MQLYNSKLSTGHKALHFQLQSVKRKLHQVEVVTLEMGIVGARILLGDAALSRQRGIESLLASVESSRQLS